MHITGLRVTFAALFAAVAVTLVVLAPASANPSKPYSIVLCGNGQIGCSSSNPAVISPGGTATLPASFSVTFTNDNKPGSGIQLGSDNLNVPNSSGFLVVGSSLPACPATFNTQQPPCFVLLNGGATVGFRSLSLAPGASISITLSAITPPPSATSCTTSVPCSWTDEAKESNAFNGTGNDLNSDSNSAYGTVTAAAAGCAKHQPCNTTLADGGTASGGAGSVNVTINTSSGNSAGTQIMSLDFGTPLDSSLCSGVTAIHEEYATLSDDADRSQQISITTTPYPGYQAQYCFFTTDQTFTDQVLTNGTASLGQATQTTVDGTTGWQGLLANCQNVGLPAPTVDCNKNPGVLQRGTQNADGTFTTVIAVPPGFDSLRGYQ